MPTIDEAFQIALNHHRAGRLAEAEDVYNRILDMAPGRLEVLYNLGYAQQMQGKLGGALATYRAFLAKAPAAAQGHARLGEMMLWTGRLGAAIDHYETAVALAPEDAVLHNAQESVTHTQIQHRALLATLHRGERLGLSGISCSAGLS
ncbi:tetratricopeptide repeat protein [Azospirillum griseum]|uniref:Tetratricopeptide repeat protein n=1 Tax=Azospirillum griseum TaxID=2496639 RepID=A0A431V9Q6_9PROT|nr:tetratricopeptide repeat protein [Azospirillum griseum]RTR12458.1 tetratricopeptide repeat protein [Azospirillum griseum]